MADKVKLPNGFDVEQLSDKFNVARVEYSAAHKRAVKLDAVDRGKLWDAVRAKFPAYQILPDTNHVAYVKNNILASVYTVGKSASLVPTSNADKEIVGQLNIALEAIWQELNVAKYQMAAGERAALLNYGITQVGWNNNIVRGSGDAFHKGAAKLKNINPLRFMRDPFAVDLDTASFCVIWDYYHASVIKSTAIYKAAFTEYLESGGGNTSMDSMPVNLTDHVSPTAANKKDYYAIMTYWVRDNNNNIHEIHLLNNKIPLYVKENIKPSIFPFAELYCNVPADDLIGTSEPARIFQNSLAYNIMSSIILTSEYKNQRPPRFVSGQSGINVATFTKHGNDADRTFVVQGDASKAVHYHSFPTATQQAMSEMAILSSDVQTISGVDGRYTGRDTGSVLTTGGINSMLDQVTMIDAPKVINYEDYSKRLTQLIISNYIEHSAIKRKYFVKNPRTLAWRTVEVDFPNISADTVFGYEIMINSELPKNKARIEATANHLMEMQMQYQGAGIDVELITPDEWLMMQDLPMKEYMQERMGIQRTQNWTTLVAQAVTEYAELVKNGVQPEEAIAVTADTMAKQSRPDGSGDRAAQEQMQQLQQGGLTGMM